MKGKPNAARPNVILVLSDDQGYGDFSCHGNPEVRTPNFDRLHDQSVRFTDFHVTPMCTPTRSEIMTGLDTLRNGATSVSGGRSYLRRGIPTVADIFRDGGYRTGLFGKWHLGESFPYRPEDRGFEETLYFPSAAITTASDYWDNDYFDDVYRHNGVAQPFKGYCTDVFFEECMKWMERCEADGKPFFAYLATGADHMPYFVPDRYRDPYRHLDIFLASFFGMVANYDENMGKLDAFLRRSGLFDNTIVIFMTDNGAVVSAEHYNAGMRGSKCSGYEGGHRVPCFVRWPAGGLRAPADVDQPAQCQDILPTLVDLCGLPRRDDRPCDGISLAGVMHDAQAVLPERKMVVQYGNPQKYPMNSAVMWKRWRLVNGNELYDLERDFGQQNNVIDQHPDVAQTMREHYERWWEGLGPDVAELECISVGNEQENPVRLAHVDWRGPSVWYQTQVRAMKGYDDQPCVINGAWRVRIEHAGEYEVELRRWPQEANAPLCGTPPEFVPTDTAFLDVPRPQGGQAAWAWIGASRQAARAVPIAKARLRIGAVDLSTPVTPRAHAAVFRVALAEGQTDVQSWFYDKDGKELGGAFYVYFRRLTALSPQRA